MFTPVSSEHSLRFRPHQPKLVAGFVDRIVGLRGGRVVFDEPAGAMLPDDLVELYGWHAAALSE
jgi:ABC-type phosphate/phosphonate transport system ATPase subunit